MLVRAVPMVPVLVLALDPLMDLDLSLDDQKAENRCMVKACELDDRSGHQVVGVNGGIGGDSASSVYGPSALPSSSLPRRESGEERLDVG